MKKLTKQQKIENAGFKIRPVLFIDADWTIRKPLTDGETFIKDESDIQLIPGIKDKLTSYSNDYNIVIISNQGGIAHGFKTEATVEKEFDVTVALLNEGLETPIMDRELVFYSPFEESGKIPPLNNKSTTRKPNTGLATAAEIYLLSKHYTMIDWKKSVMVGDREEDAKFAKNLGIKFIHVNEFIADGIPVKKPRTPRSSEKASNVSTISE